jgi:hypothetical protein
MISCGNQDQRVFRLKNTSKMTNLLSFRLKMVYDTWKQMVSVWRWVSYLIVKTGMKSLSCFSIVSVRRSAKLKILDSHWSKLDQ